MVFPNWPEFPAPEYTALSYFSIAKMCKMFHQTHQLFVYRYVGVRSGDGPTDFNPLKAAVQKEAASSQVRSARAPRLVLSALRALNDKFSGRLNDTRGSVLPPEFFSCSCVCASCEGRCEKSMGHVRDNEAHSCATMCTFQHQFYNCEYLCASCYNNGQRQIVVPKMATASDQTSWFGIAK